jgi:RimJ/RimL family protein N-acetyltransferase
LDTVPAWRPAIARPELLDVPDAVVGPRLMVRRYAPGDGAAMFAAMLAHRDELMRWMSWPSAHQAPADSESYVRRMHAEFALRRTMPMGIWERDTHGYVGGTGFHAPDWQVPAAEIGYFLVAPARGRGYATEAVALLVRFAFDHLNVNRVHASCDAANAASAGVLRRAGLLDEGCRRAQARDHHGHVRDTLQFGLTLSDFAEWSALRDPLRDRPT